MGGRVSPTGEDRLEEEELLRRSICFRLTRGGWAFTSTSQGGGE